jgi:hypothetical protein
MHKNGNVLVVFYILNPQICDVSSSHVCETEKFLLSSLHYETLYDIIDSLNNRKGWMLISAVCLSKLRLWSCRL